jgi:long-chain acyl-CoA synthetase
VTYQASYTDLIALLNFAVSRHAARRFLGSRKQGQWHYVTYGEFGALADAMRAGLAGLGVQAGDTVAVISDNRLEWAVGAFGAVTLGATYVPMYQAQKDREHRYILHDAGVKLCFVANQKLAERLRALQPELPALKHIIVFDSPEYAALLEAGREAPVPVAPVSADSLAFLIYTSGTTDDPKGVELTHKSLGASISGFIAVAPFRRDDPDITVGFLPWAHVFGGCAEIGVVMGCGATLAICDNVEHLLEYIAEIKPTALFAVPRIWTRVYEGVNKQIDALPKPVRWTLRAGLAASTKRRKGGRLALHERAALLAAERLLMTKIKARLGGRLRFAISAAAALAPEIAEFIDALGIMVLEGYGLTESGAGGTVSLPDKRRIGAVGVVEPGVRIELDKQVPAAGPGEGEIILYGACVMRGYHNRPDLTQEVITEDGGLRTGDIGRVDEDGFLYITGRVKELYKLSNGRYVAPAPLEEKLQLSPYIAQAFVHGADRPYNTAVIILNPQNVNETLHRDGANGESGKLSTSPAVRELIKHEVERFNTGFKGFEHIRHFVLDEDPFTTQNDLLTQTLKLKRRNVLVKYQEQLNALYK